MKKKYFCDTCGQDFDSEKECNEHEKKCSKVVALEKRVKELEDRIDILEKYWEIMKTPNTLPYPYVPSTPTVPTTPTVPNNPYNPPIWWSWTSSATEMKYQDELNGKSNTNAKKVDRNPKA